MRFEPVQSVPVSAAEPLNPLPAPDVRQAPAFPNNPADFASLLAQAKLEKGSPFFVAWEVPLDGADPAPAARGIVDAGGTPWLSLIFRTPAPLAQNFERLQGELRAAAVIAAATPGVWLQVVWRPEGQEGQAPSASEMAFLLKRAAVALTGARSDARVASDALPADPAFLKALYEEDVAAYLEAIVLKPEGNLEQAVAAIQEADPGRPIVLDSAPVPAAPGELLSDAARNAVRGIGLTLFRATEVGPQIVSPLALLVREFTGDISYDAGSIPTGAEEAWTFVRGKDFSLRVIALAPAGAPDLTLRFPDPYLRRPSRFPYTFDKVGPPAGEVKGNSLEVRLDNPGRVAVIGLERASAAERGEEGVEEKLSVATERQMPVEEILRRLQAFEDAQDRKLDTYSAINTTHMRFQPAAGSQTVEATLQGPFFFDKKTGSDWAWETLYVNGVKWRSKSIPEIPLVQPEKAAALPVQITFTRQYRYRLRGSDTVDGRDAWVVDFAPIGEGAPGKLYQGSVWVDKQIYARLRTRAVQIGLEGEVISNEETLHYKPVDAMGLPAPWSSESYVLPLRVVTQQILSVVNATTVVERETEFSEVRINAPDFAAKRAQVSQTDMTMVRDTEVGLRYLVKQEGSEERVIKEGYDTNKLFLAGGVFYDDALDYPLPLGGVNYLDFDFRGTGKQVNLFFAGALLTLNAAEPRLFGSKFDVGADLFVLAVPFSDNVFRDDREIFAEEVEQRTSSFGLKLGRLIGNFVKLSLDYDVLFLNYGESDDTGDGFVLPSDNQTHSVELSASYSRAGYGFSVHGSMSRRSKWEPWGFPGSPDYENPQPEFARWGARLSKNWYLPRFQKIGAEIDWVSGSDLDRFSKYQFGFFGSTRVHGYQSNRVRAEEAVAAHLSYGFEIGQFLRLDAVGDVAWATDEATGLDNELLAGAGLAGTFVGPWQTLINLDVGVPVAGPDDGFVMYLVFLKLFK